MSSEGVILLDPAVDQLLNLAYLFPSHTTRQIEIKAESLSLQKGDKTRSRLSPWQHCSYKNPSK